MIWLINVHSGKLEKFQNDFPRYAILSHTWGDDNDEIHFDDINKRARLSKKGPGRRKFDGCRQQAKTDGFDYIWIDTCCIDKTHHTDYSEAITSMFSWYQRAGRCYAYLADVPDTDESTFHSDFMNSRWHKRGWTLQELLAPKDLVFYSKNWTKLGEKCSMSSLLEEATAIPSQFLSGFRDASVAQRMSWAAQRRTKRVEDMAYCLYGIFDVKLPVQYGEGASAAFRRLQEEILRTTPDPSILAWGLNLEDEDVSVQKPPIMRYGHILAASPSDFMNCGTIVPWENIPSVQRVELQGGYHSIEFPLHTTETGITYGLLKCYSKPRENGWIGIPLCLVEPEGEADEYMRPKEGMAVQLFDLDLHPSHKPQKLRFRHASHAEDIENIDRRYGYKIEMPISNELTLCEVYPSDRWETDRNFIITGVDFLRDVVQKTWISIRHITDPGSDFVIMLEFEIRSSQPRLECHVMIASRNVGLDTISREGPCLPSFSQLMGKDSASIGICSLRVNRRTRRPRGYAIYEISFSKLEMDPEYTVDITSEMDLLGFDRRLDSYLTQSIETGTKINKTMHAVHEKQAHIHHKNILLSSAKKEVERLPLEVAQLETSLEPLCLELEGVLKERQRVLRSISSLEESLPLSAGVGRLVAWHSAVVKKLARTLPVQDAEIESVADDKVRLFIQAISAGHLGAMEYLFARLGDATLKTKTTARSVRIAIKYGYIEGLIWLIQKGFDIDAQDSDGLTPLGSAASDGILPICLLLLQNGAAINLEGADCKSPLVLAVVNDHIEVVGLLLDRKARKSRSSAGFNALSMAAQYNRIEIARLLVNAKASREIKDRDGQTPLAIAASRGHDAVVQLLLDRQANIETTGSFDRTPLAVAARKGHVRTARILLDHGANMKARDRFDRTPLLLAAREDHHPMVSLLLDLGDDIEAKDKGGWSALALAAREGFQQAAQVLLDRKADIESRDSTRSTPLTLAVANQHHQMVQLLVENNANIGARDSAGHTALVVSVEKARESDGLVITSFLLSQFAWLDFWTDEPSKNLTGAMHHAISLGRVGHVQLLLAVELREFTSAQKVDFLAYAKSIPKHLGDTKPQTMGQIIAMLQDAITPLEPDRILHQDTTTNTNNNTLPPGFLGNVFEPDEIAESQVQINGQQTFNGMMAQSSTQSKTENVSFLILHQNGNTDDNYGGHGDFERKRKFATYNDDFTNECYGHEGVHSHTQPFPTLQRQYPGSNPSGYILPPRSQISGRHRRENWRE